MAGYWNIYEPTATTNLVTNPSFETGTTGWSADGTNTIAQSASQQCRGAYSLLCTYQDDTDLARFASLTLTAAAYVFSAHVYLSSTWDGGAVQLAIENFASASTGTATTTTTTTGEWVRLEMTFTPDGGDLTGDLIIETASAPTAGRTIYVDAVQCELQSTITSYCDGDQDGCYWTGTRHASSSTRYAYTASGGHLRNFDDDLSVPIESAQGAGHYPVVNVAQPQALQPGELYEGTAAQRRTMTFRVTPKGTSMSNLHSTRQALIKALNPLTGKINKPTEPRRLKYTGATVNKEIDAVYDGGLEGRNSSPAAEELAFRMIAHNPLWQSEHDSGAELDEQNTETFTCVAHLEDGEWDSMGPPDASGSYTSARAILRASDGSVYIAGVFANFDNIAAADYIVKYNPVAGTYSAITGAGNEADGEIYTLAEDANGNIWAGGGFTDIGGVTCRGIAYYDGTDWNAVGPPSSGGIVYAIVIGPDGTVYAGGDFTNWDGDADADYIVQYDVGGSSPSWEPVGGPANGIVWDLAIDNDGTLYAAGAFTTINSVDADRIAKYDSGSSAPSWQAIGTQTGGGGFGGTVYALAIGSGGTVYAGGSFSAADQGNVTVAGVAEINGDLITPLGDGVTGTIWALAARNSEVWIGGVITAAGDLTNIDGLCVWNGTTYLNSGLDSATAGKYAYDIFVDGNDEVWVANDINGSVYVAGTTTSVSYSGTAWGYPIIVLEASTNWDANLRKIANNTTGASLYFDYDFHEGETLIIDTRPGKRKIMSSRPNSSRPPGFYDATDILLPGSDWTSFYLVPGNGTSARTNSISLFLYGTGTINAYMYWRDGYASYD